MLFHCWFYLVQRQEVEALEVDKFNVFLADHISQANGELHENLGEFFNMLFI